MVQGTGICCIALLPALIASAGIVTSLLSTIWCETIQFIPDLHRAPTFLNLTAQTRDILADRKGFAVFQFGLFYYSQAHEVILDTSGEYVFKVTDVCVEYEDGLHIDGAWKAARAFSLIAPLVAGFLATGLYMAPCCIFYSRWTWSMLALLFLLVVPALQAMTMLFILSNACDNNPVIANRIASATEALADPSLNKTDVVVGLNLFSDYEQVGNNTEYSHAQAGLESIFENGCEWDWGMYANLLSMVLFFVTGVVMFVMGAPTRPPPKEPEMQTVTYQQTTNEETGDVVVEEVNVTTTTIKGKNVSPVAASTPTTTEPSPPYIWASTEQAKPY